RPPEGRPRRPSSAIVDGQDEQRVDGARDGADGAGRPRCRGDRRRAPDHTASHEPRDRDHLRGHPRCPHADHRARPDGAGRLRLNLPMGDESLLRPGEVVLLVDLRRGKRHLVTLRSGQAFHSDRGFIPYDSLVGLPEGVVMATTKGARYLALRPTLAEYVLEMPRGAQIIYPKDLATIALFADVGPGQTVVEAGLGSGALTLVLLRLVGPTGRGISSQTRQEVARAAPPEIQARPRPPPPPPPPPPP